MLAVRLWWNWSRLVQGAHLVSLCLCLGLQGVQTVDLVLSAAGLYVGREVVELVYPLVVAGGRLHLLLQGVVCGQPVALSCGACTCTARISAPATAHAAAGRCHCESAKHPCTSQDEKGLSQDRSRHEPSIHATPGGLH